MLNYNEPDCPINGNQGNLFCVKLYLTLCFRLNLKLLRTHDFVNCLQRTFSDTNVLESQECYLLGDINIIFQPEDKEIFRHKSVNTINKEIPHLTRSYLELCFTHFLEQIITRPTRVIDQTATFIDPILTNSPDRATVLGKMFGTK